MKAHTVLVCVVLTVPSGLSAGDELAVGRAVYESACRDCHGAEGRGDGSKSKKLGFRPRDMSRGVYKCRCTESGELATDADLTRTVTNGMPGTPMTAFAGKLSAAEIAAVVTYVKAFATRFAEEDCAPCVEIPSATTSTPAAVDEGRQLYRLLQCWQCHGAAGDGDGPSAKELKDDWGEPSKPYRFTRRNRFKCGGEAVDLYRTLHTGMDGSPMPSYASALVFGRESGANLSAVERLYGAEAVAELSAYLGTQPTRSEIESGSEAESELIESRSWSLVHYVRSLAGESAP